MAIDLVLSAGFLAFARHVGFLRAVEAANLDIDGLCGTSSGALVGALWAAGSSADDLAIELSARRPLAFVRPHCAVWRGAFSLDAMIARLRQLIPPRFEDLERPFAVGVMDEHRQHHLITQGPLPEAVAASCAIPILFAPVQVEGRLLADGGIVDRTAVQAWLQWRGRSRCLLHHVAARHSPLPGTLPEGVDVVYSAASGAHLWSLGDFDGQAREASEVTSTALAP